jgi:cation diffusion facilitator family transporter
MDPQRRTALVSVAAAVFLIVLKLAVRPADVAHQYGHGKAEHLGALAEGAILFAASCFIAWRAITHLVGSRGTSVEATWYALTVIAIVIVVDLSRTIVTWRASRRYRSAALSANALHFGSDLAGSAAVLIGLLLVRAGYLRADSAAALFVAALVLLAAARLMKRNVDVLMDRVPAGAEKAARAAIAGIEPAVTLGRLRMRQAGPRQFADVVITVPPGAAVGQGHAAADRVEEALHDALPGSDVVVHVEPEEDEAQIRDRAHAAALEVPTVREVHNVSVLNVGGRTEVSLHLKLPGDLTLEEAHDVANQVEQAIEAAVPEIDAVQTHLEPLTEEAEGRRRLDDSAERGIVLRIVREITGAEPRDLRFLDTADGLVAHLTLGLQGDRPLADAHAQASEIEERIRRVRPEISDVVVHTEP